MATSTIKSYGETTIRMQKFDNTNTGYITTTIPLNKYVGAYPENWGAGILITPYNDNNNLGLKVSRISDGQAFTDTALDVCVLVRDK